jgi:hypothetical protein
MAFPTVPSIPVPTNDPRSLVQAILALKQTHEAAGPRTTPITAPTTVNIQLGAAIERVKG